MILARLDKSFTGSTMARIAVEVLEEEDVKLLVKSWKVDWKETAENEDPAILWALKNEKFGKLSQRRCHLFLPSSDNISKDF